MSRHVSSNCTSPLPANTNAVFDMPASSRWSQLLLDVRNFSSLPELLRGGQSVTFKTHYQCFKISLNGNNVQIVTQSVPRTGFWGWLKHVTFNITHSSILGPRLGHISLQDRENTIRQQVEQMLCATSQPVSEESAHLLSKASGQESFLSQQERSKLFDKRNFSPEEKAIRQKICQQFGIADSEWPRQYAPISNADTCAGTGSIDANSISILKAYMDEYHREARAAKEAAGIFPDDDSNAGILKWILGIIAPEWENLSTNGEHGYGHSYANNAILRVVGAANTDKVEKIDLNGVPALRINGKSVLLQQATRGCIAAVASMLIADQGSAIDPSALRKTNLGDDSTISALIQAAGLQVVISPLSDSNKEQRMQELKTAINKNGPAIVSVDSGVGSHVVIIDAVSDTFVTIRDPAHGWMVEIRYADFVHSLSTDPQSNILQIQQQGYENSRLKAQQQHQQPPTSDNKLQPFTGLSSMVKNRQKTDAAADKALRDKWQQRSQLKTDWATRTISTRNSGGVELFNPGGTTAAWRGITAWCTGGKIVVSQQSIVEQGGITLKSLTGSYFLSGVASMLMLLVDKDRHHNLSDDLTGRIDANDGTQLVSYVNSRIQSERARANKIVDSIEQKIIPKKYPVAIYSAFSSKNAHKNMNELKNAVATRGPAIAVVTNNTRKNSFFVVIDAVNEGLVTVRDPTRDAIVEMTEAELMA